MTERNIGLADGPGNDAGHDPLVMRELELRLCQNGRLTFAEFMSLALYYPGAGYYCGQERRADRDYRTSPQTHPLFGALVALQIEQMWRLLGCPGRFHIVELGAGDGSLCRDILRFAPRIGQAFERSLRYVTVETASLVPDSPSRQRRIAPPPRADTEAPSLRPKSSRCGIVGSAVTIPFRGLTGCIIANELVDALPVHRVVWQNGALYESYVVERDGVLTSQLGEPSTDELASYFDWLGIFPRNGALVEVNLAASRYVAEAAAALDRGFLITIDYGSAAEDLYLSGRPEGTLRCFHRHRCHADPFRAIGRQDITSHVDFSALALAGRHAVLRLSGLNTQREFLLNLGYEAFAGQLDTVDLPDALRYDSKFAIQELVSRAGLGSFRVLAQHKGLHDPELDGYNPCNERRRALLAGKLQLDFPF